MADTVENDAALLKLIKKLPTGFKEEADKMKEEELRNCVVESSHNLETAVAELKEKEEYKKLKMQWKELNEPIREIKKAQKSKIAYALHCLELKGKL